MYEEASQVANDAVGSICYCRILNKPFHEPKLAKKCSKTTLKLKKSFREPISIIFGKIDNTVLESISSNKNINIDFLFVKININQVF